MNYPLSSDMLNILGADVQAIASLIAIAAALLLFAEQVKQSNSSVRAEKLNESINYLAAITFPNIIDFREKALDKGADYVDKIMETLPKRITNNDSRHVAQYHAYNIRIYHKSYFEGREEISGRTIRLFGFLTVITLIVSLGSMCWISFSPDTVLLNVSFFMVSIILSGVCIIGTAYAFFRFYS